MMRTPERWWHYPRGQYNPIEYIISNFAIFSFHVGLAMFAWTELLPEPNPLLPVEIAVVGVSLTVALLVLIRVLAPKVDIFMTQYVYLFSILSSLLTTVAFVIGEDQVSWELRTIIFLFLLMGVLVSMQMHIAYGGGRSRKTARVETEG
jgi:hypothetical protein